MRNIFCGIILNLKRQLRRFLALEAIICSAEQNQLSIFGGHNYIVNKFVKFQIWAILRLC